MRMLRKKGTTDRVYPWHEMLERRGDMEEFDDGRPEPNKSKPFEEHLVAQEAEGITVPTIKATPDAPLAVGEKIDPASITDKDQLKAMLADRGVKLMGNPSVSTLQAKLAETMGVSHAGD